VAQADVFGIGGGPAAPAATLGPYTMTPFGPDASPEYSTITSITSPLGGSLGFDIGMSHRLIGSSWATWSHGYTGDVYYTNGAMSITMAMPAGTGAFYFYAEPNPFALYEIVATTPAGTSISQSVDGNAGAAYYGFYGTDGDLLNTITVSSGVDFAVGEFGIAEGTLVPLPGAALLAAIGLGYASLRLRRRTA
jgi:hypothetical protein